MIVSRYNKTNALTGSNEIIDRFLPAELSKKVAAWLIVVRPLYHKLAKGRYEGIAQDVLDFVFIKK